MAALQMGFIVLKEKVSVNKVSIYFFDVMSARSKLRGIADAKRLDFMVKFMFWVE